MTWFQLHFCMVCTTRRIFKFVVTQYQWWCNLEKNSLDFLFAFKNYCLYSDCKLITGPFAISKIAHNRSWSVDPRHAGWRLTQHLGTRLAATMEIIRRRLIRRLTTARGAPLQLPPPPTTNHKSHRDSGIENMWVSWVMIQPSGLSSRLWKHFSSKSILYWLTHFLV